MAVMRMICNGDDGYAVERHPSVRLECLYVSMYEDVKDDTAIAAITVKYCACFNYWIWIVGGT